MDKINKKLLSILLVIYTLLGSGVTASDTYTFTCLCSSQLTSAFNYMDSNIIDENLVPIYDNLKESNKRVKKNIEALEKNNVLLEKKIKLEAKQLLELQEYLATLKKGNHILISKSRE